MTLKKLQKNDLIGIICPSFKGDVKSERVRRAEQILRDWGYRVKYGASCYASDGYLAGPDELRCQDLEGMFADKEVKAILCLKGGYGASRIVDRIQYDIIRNNPKLFIGFSDITVLLSAFYKQCQMPSIHGQVSIFLGKEEIDQASLNDFKLLLQGHFKDRILKNPNDDALTLVPGTAEGVLIGGNLMLLTNLIGSEYDLDYTDKIVFIEEIGEEPYSIDRMFAQLRLSKKIDQAKGFIFGHFTDCATKDEGKKGTQTVDDLIYDYFHDLKKPVITHFSSGHAFPFINLPIGLKVELNADTKEIKVLEELYEKS